MALPATDTFTVASDGYLHDLIANWTRINPSGTGAFSLLASQDNIFVDGSYPFYYWNADTPDAAQYSQLKITTVGGDEMGPMARITVANATGYGYLCTSGKRTLYRYDAEDSQTSLGSVASGASNNDVLRVECSSSTITPVRNGSTDASIGAKTDATYGSGRFGCAGITTWAGDTRGDNWEGGNLGAAAPTVNVAEGSTAIAETVKAVMGDVLVSLSDGVTLAETVTAMIGALRLTGADSATVAEAVTATVQSATGITLSAAQVGALIRLTWV